MLQAAYGEPHRHYHDIGHIEFCLAQFDRVVDRVQSPAAVELAIWFHDVVHQPGNTDNEVASAALFREWAAGLDPALVDAVTSMIVDTIHRDRPSTADGHYVVDIDLASLGQSWESFQSASEALRLEQDDLSPAAYAAAQHAFLDGLMTRPKIYRTPYFQDRYEGTARANINRMLKNVAA